MAETRYGKYVRTGPVKVPPRGKLAFHSESYNEDITREETGGEAQTHSGSGVYLNADAFPGCPYYVSVQRTTEAPPDQPFLLKHVHEDVDEIVMFIAAGPDADLGTTVTFEMGEEGEKHTFSETTVIYIPAGVTHGPMFYSSPFKEGKQFYLMVWLNQADYPMEE
jgi:hypothetical protein